jgi:hypothetical protein
MLKLPLTNVSFVEMKILKLIRLLIYTNVLKKLMIISLFWCPLFFIYFLQYHFVIWPPK